MQSAIQLFGASWYEAPRSRNIIPVQVAPDMELVEILTGGRVWFEFDGVDRLYERGTIFWHLPGEFTVCRNDPEQPYRCLVLYFSCAYARERLPRVSFWREVGELNAFCRDMLQCAHDDRVDKDIMAPMLYHRLIWEGNRGLRQCADTELPAPLRRAAALLEKECSHPWTVAELARRVGVSPSYLHALCERHWRLSPHRYLLQRRLYQARMALVSEGTGIKEIAVRCGFVNLESFYRAFRTHCDMTPGEYRRRHALPEILP